MPKINYPQLKEGDVYNDLKIKNIYFKKTSPEKKYGRKRFVVECFCGNVFDCDSANLMNGHTKSCGCIYQTITGLPRQNHGMSETPTWQSWKSMLHRCLNPTEREKLYYGNIEVCKEWILFENFFADMGERPEGTSLDRIDPNLGYFPENCRWADRTIQSYNRKTSSKNTSGVTGVYWSKAMNKWCAYINKYNKRVYTGYFEDFDKAAEVRKEKEVEVYGFNV